MRLFHFRARQKHIWFDGQCFQSASRYRGIGRFVHEFILHLVRHHPDWRVSTSLNATLYDELIIARRKLEPVLGAENIHVWEGLTATGGAQTPGGELSDLRRADDLILAHHIATLSPDVTLAPSPIEGQYETVAPFLARHQYGIPATAIFHDAIPLRYPEQYLPRAEDRAFFDRRLADLARFDHVFANSDFSRDEFRDLVPDVPCTTIGAGLSADFIARLDQTPPPKDKPVGQPFNLLYVGGMDWRKNVPRVIDAIAGLPRALQKHLTFTIVGDQSSQQAKILLAQAQSLKLRKNLVKFTGYLDGFELFEAYSAADILIQPSLMEGFGLTALEAMACGTVVLSSDAGALPEVVGNSDLLFDPENVPDITAKLKYFMTHPEAMSAARTAGLAQAKRFDWKEAAQIAVDVWTTLPRSSAPKKIKKIRTLTAKYAQLDRPVPVEVLTNRLSAVEAQPAREPGLYIDVTSTLEMDHGTGIQRVVKKITDQIQTFDPDAKLIMCDSEFGFEPVKRQNGRFIRAHGVGPRLRQDFGPGDIVMMLDSSWNHHRHHKNLLRAARARGAKIYNIVYDLVPVRLPGFTADGMPDVYSDWLESALEFSDGFMCISRAVAEDMHDFLTGIEFPRPFKIGYWGLGADFGSLPDMSNVCRESNRFLTVATLEPRKAHKDMLDVFDRLWAAGETPILELIGRPGWDTDALQDRIRGSKWFGQYLFWNDKASDVDLARAYAQAGTLIAPSYAEGFGLPIVEGARQGCRILARDISVFREVAPDGAHFFETQSEFSAEVHKLKDLPLTDLGDVPEVLSWRGSAEELVHKLRDNIFEINYEPVFDDPWIGGSEIGERAMTEAIPIKEARLDIRLLDGPNPRKAHPHLRYTLEVTNRTGRVLISRGNEDGGLGVFFSTQVLGKAGKGGKVGEVLSLDQPRTPFPFALGIDQSVILNVDVEDDLAERGARQLKIGAVQEGVAWWPDQLSFDL